MEERRRMCFIPPLMGLLNTHNVSQALGTFNRNNAAHEPWSTSEPISKHSFQHEPHALSSIQKAHRTLRHFVWLRPQKAWPHNRWHYKRKLNDEDFMSLIALCVCSSGCFAYLAEQLIRCLVSKEFLLLFAQRWTPAPKRRNWEHSVKCIQFNHCFCNHASVEQKLFHLPKCKCCPNRNGNTWPISRKPNIQGLARLVLFEVESFHA